MAGLGSLVVSLGLNATDFTQGLTKAEQDAQKFASSAAAIGTKIGAGLGVGLVAAAGALVTMVKQQATAIDAFNDLKDATGASIENISALDDVARRTGGDFATVETSLIKFNAALNAAKPDSDAVKALQALGLNAKELKRLDPAEALRQTAVALAAFADDGNKARLTQELFGKSLKEVAPFLKDLSEQQELVAKTTTAQAEEAEKFNKQLFAMQANATDAARSMVNDLLPVLNGLFEGFKKAKAEGTLFTDVLKGIATFSPLGFTLDKLKPDTEALERLIAAREKTLAANPRDKDTERVLNQLKAELALRKQVEAVKVTAFRPSQNYGEMFKPSAPGIPDKVVKTPISEAQRYLETLQKQAEATDQMTAREKALNEIQKARLEGITPKLKEQILAQAQIVDQLKYEADQRRNLEDAIVAVREARERLVEASAAEAKSMKESNDALALEVQTIGLSAEGHIALERARISSAIALKEEAIAALSADEINRGLGRTLEDQIEQLNRRAALLNDKQSADAFAAQIQKMEDDVRSLRVALVHCQAKPEMRVVIEIRACRNNPINEAGLNQRDQCGHAESRRSKSARQRNAHGYVGLDHLFGEELTRLAQTRGVVSNEGVVDEIDQRRCRIDRLRIDPSPTQKFTLLLCQRFLV